MQSAVVEHHYHKEIEQKNVDMALIKEEKKAVKKSKKNPKDEQEIDAQEYINRGIFFDIWDVK